jgi:hypothetical protein
MKLCTCTVQTITSSSDLKPILRNCAGGLDEALNNIIEMSRQQNVPFVFALGRRALGRVCAKLVPVSIVGIFCYEGTEVSYSGLTCVKITVHDRNPCIALCGRKGLCGNSKGVSIRESRRL